jgi:hypothetical protein
VPRSWESVLSVAQGEARGCARHCRIVVNRSSVRHSFLLQVRLSKISKSPLEAQVLLNESVPSSKQGTEPAQPALPSPLGSRTPEIRFDSFSARPFPTPLFYTRPNVLHKGEQPRKWTAPRPLRRSLSEYHLRVLYDIARCLMLTSYDSRAQARQARDRATVRWHLRVEGEA